MERLNAMVREDHIVHLKDIKKSADGDIADAEAVRRVFDRSQEADQYQNEADHLRERLDNIEDQYETELDQLRQEYEQEIAELETRAERVEKQNLLILQQREETTELVKRVDEAQEWRDAGMVKRWKWRIMGRNTA